MRFPLTVRLASLLSRRGNDGLTKPERRYLARKYQQSPGSKHLGLRTLAALESDRIDDPEVIALLMSGPLRIDGRTGEVEVLLRDDAARETGVDLTDDEGERP